MDEFLDEFNGIKVGGKVKIKEEYFDFNKSQGKSVLPALPLNFILHIMYNKNRFTVETIQKFEDDVNICVKEVEGIVLGSNQVDPLIPSNRILNWQKL